MGHTTATYLQGLREQGKKKLAVLIDPDKAGRRHLDRILETINNAGIELIFFGGSLLTRYELDEQINYIKSTCNARVVLFPGSSLQVSPAADALLFLSLI